MNNLEYLNEISKSNRPARPSLLGKSSPIGLILKILGVATALVIVAIIAVNIINSRRDEGLDSINQLYTRSVNIKSAVNTYNSYLKSPPLRALSITLDGSLTSITTQINGYISTYITVPLSDTDPEAGYAQNPTLPEKTLAYEDALSSQLSSVLYRARLNGTLDNIYSSQIELQISSLIPLINNTIDLNANDPERAPLMASLAQALSSINTIYTSFREYNGNT